MTPEQKKLREVARDFTKEMTLRMDAETIVILYSLTASDEATLDSEREFLFMPNRFNVAVTRARKKLIVVGSRRFFHHVPQDLRFASWQGAEGAQTRRMLDEAKAFKRWYLEHRGAAVDLTAQAMGCWRRVVADPG